MLKYDRRLSDKIVIAHLMSIEEDKPRVADLLIQALELDLSGIGGAVLEKRKSLKDIEDAFERHEEFRQRHAENNG
ncbi:hypothetical protein [Roseospirillum parvum]|uniref:Uncharacterized protein n=1 Tax=Roseospirillum parvum TaxID=83401 RepID=A0A1G7ZRP1_9PROT|nr:hypothetical protein [Roseospirillum parvum]SDH11345.1 hypothetical protein SAMN05421742_104197 [Roseospirillum parvum]